MEPSGHMKKVLVSTDKGTLEAEYRNGTVRIWAAIADGSKWKIVQEIKVGDSGLYRGMSEDEIAHFVAKRWADSRLGQ